MKFYLNLNEGFGRLLLLSVGFFLTGLFPGIGEAGEWVWTSETGLANTSQYQGSQVKKQFQQAMKFYNNGEYNRALREFARLTKLAKNENLRERSYFMWAECLYRTEEYLEAYRKYKAYLKEFPNTDRKTYVLKRELDIGFKLMEGKDSRRLLGLPILPATATGKKIIHNILSTYPYQSFSDNYQYRLANFYFRRDKYTEAVQEYKILLQNYDRSKWAPNARFLMGMAYYRQFESIAYDMGTLKKAEDQFKTYIQKYPGGRNQKKAKRILRAIEKSYARKDFSTAEFYSRTHKPEAARYYYMEVIRNHADTSWAQRALDRLDEMDVEVRKEIRQRVRGKKKKERDRSRKKSTPSRKGNSED